jgi:hypothetical protein
MESRQARFFGLKKKLTEAELDFLTHVLGAARRSAASGDFEALAVKSRA